jgi:protein-disulfide isomerase-like protein with CxxC motif
MPAFFSRQRGTVSRVTGQRGGAPMPFQLKMQGMGIGSDNPTARAIITQAGISQRGSVQFLHTIGETIYAYIFGDRMGELRVSGVAFSSLCGDSVSAVSSAPTGFQQVLDEYQEHRVANIGRPVLVNFGNAPFKGFLVDMSLELTDAETHLGQWSYRFASFPGRR